MSKFRLKCIKIYLNSVIYPDVSGSKSPFFFIHMTLQASPVSLTAFGDTSSYGVPPARADDSCLVLSMTPRTSRICLLYSTKNEVLALCKCLSTSMKCQPRRDSIQRFQPVPKGHAITQFRASAPRTYHSIRRKEPRNKITWVSN